MTDDPDAGTGCATTDGVKEAYGRTEELREHLPEAELKTTKELVIGSRLVEVPRAYDPDRPDFVLEHVTLPEPRLLSDYASVPCKHVCGIIKQIRHAKHANILLSTLNPIKQFFYELRQGSAVWNRPAATRPLSKRWSNWTAREAWREGLEKHLFFALELCSVMDCQWTMLE
jgi:hypothetical protein